MRQEGLIQPITLRKLLPMAGDRQEPGYELVSGERRLRAAKLLGWERIEARVISVVTTCTIDSSAIFNSPSAIKPEAVVLTSGAPPGVGANPPDGL